MKKYENYGATIFNRPRKVKHVHFITATDTDRLESQVNCFADEHPEYKILGIKLTISQQREYDLFIATVSYLCDAACDDSLGSETPLDNYDDDSDSDEE